MSQTTTQANDLEPGALYSRRVKKARALFERFGFTSEPIARQVIDASLIAEGHRPADAKRRERGTYRHDFLNQVHSASESPAMREIGLEPCGPSYR